MGDTRRAMKILDNKSIGYTILRGVYRTNENKINYQLTEKGQSYQGTVLSRERVADFIGEGIKHLEYYSFSSLGIAQPNTASTQPRYGRV